jgi:O-antigen/teichoic acid export membrane protein
MSQSAETNTPTLDYAAPAVRQASKGEALGTIAGRGVVFMTAVSLLTRVTSFAQNIILAWLLAPNVWGQFILASAASVAAMLISKPGLEDFLIQRGKRMAGWENATFWLSATLGALGMALMLVSGAVASVIRSDWSYFWILAAMSPGALVNALSTVSTCKLSTGLRFARSAWLASIAALLNPLVSIALAASGAGVYALALPPLCVSAVLAVLYFRTAPPDVRWLAPEIQRWPVILGATSLRFCSRWCWSIVGQADYVTLGLFFAEAIVGVYYYAFLMATQIARLLSQNLTAVLMPSLTSIAGDPKRQVAAVYRSSRLIATLTIPLSILLAAIADPLFRVITPARLHDAIFLTQLLSIATLSTGCFAPAMSLVLARGQFKRELVIAIGSAIGFCSIVSPLAWAYGPIGASVGVWIYCWIDQSVRFKLYVGEDASWFDMARICAAPVIASTIAFVPLAWLVLTTMDPSTSVTRVTAIGIVSVAGVAIYFAVIAVLTPTIARDLFQRFLAMSGLRGQRAGNLARRARTTILHPNMRNLTKRLLEALPVPLAMWIESTKRSIAPAAGYTRIRSVMRQLGEPKTILAGPFKDMRYVGEAVGSAYLPKVVGTYEHELHDVIAEYLRGDFDLLVDFGAAEGYYAVGFAWKMPKLRVITFDISKRARWLQGDMARRNGVRDRIDIRGEGDPASLNAALEGSRKPLIICDCEGYEDALLKPDLAPNLRRATLLVEMHDHLVPGASQRLHERFDATHTSRTIRTVDRPPEHLLERLAPADRDVALEGRKAPQDWIILTPR